ncbi:MAG: HAD-IIB family hydrolase [Deinococcales bacterium]
MSHDVHQRDPHHSSAKAQALSLQAKPYFIVSDIDHTLLNEHGDLVEANKLALQEAIAQGDIVILATARSYIGALDIYKELGLNTPLIVNNGTVICDAEGYIIRSVAIAPPMAERVFEMFRQTPYHWAIRINDTAHLHPDFDRSNRHFQNERFYRPLDFIHLEETLGDFDDVVSISLFGDASMQQFYSQHDWEAMGLKPSYYPPSHYDSRETMSVISAEANKGKAVAWLRQAMGLDDSPTLLMGDSPDDITMFHLGIGVAPSNASGSALKASDWIGPSSNEGLVAAAMKRFVFKERQKKASKAA